MRILIYDEKKRIKKRKTTKNSSRSRYASKGKAAPNGKIPGRSKSREQPKIQSASGEASKE